MKAQLSNELPQLLSLSSIVFLGILFSCSSTDTSHPESGYRIDFIAAILADSTDSRLFKPNPVVSTKPNDMGSFMQRYDSITEAFVKFDSEVKYLGALLVESDTNYIRSQFKNRHNFKLDSLAIFGTRLINVDSLYTVFTADSVWGYITEKVSDGYYVVSMPIFNKAHDRAYIKISFLCGGHCGSGYEAVFEKQKHKWVLKERLGEWVS